MQQMLECTETSDIILVGAAAPCCHEHDAGNAGDDTEDEGEDVDSEVKASPVSDSLMYRIREA